MTVLVGCGESVPGDRSGWRTLPPAPLAARGGHVAVWTGERMLVWGGAVVESRRGADDPRTPAGASYDPRTSKWTELVEERFADGAAYDPETDRAAYDPVADRWRPLPPAPIRGRIANPAVWTGEALIVWGGSDDSGTSHARGDGAALAP